MYKGSDFQNENIFNAMARKFVYFRKTVPACDSDKG